MEKRQKGDAVWEKHALGVLIDSGVESWQVVQQDPDGFGTLSLRGRWIAPQEGKRFRVFVRLVSETTGAAVRQGLDWTPASTARNGSWRLDLAGIPAGGLYRLETCLNVDGGPIEWSIRGDMAHHLGVGDIWVIAGQSNAEGHGRSPVDDGPVLGVHAYAARGHWALATHPLGDSTQTVFPPNRLSSNVSHSPWLAFGKRLQAELGHPIGLLPASLGGSPLQAWHRKTGGHLFANMLAYVKGAGGAVRGMVWYQGESDTGPAPRRTYRRRFREFVRDVRGALDCRGLPVITVQLNHYIGEAYGAAVHEGWEAIRETQRQLARRMKGVYVVSSLDLGLSDGIHTNAVGNVVLGERVASVALGAVAGVDVKYLHPDCEGARALSPRRLELIFANVGERLHYENNIPEQLPFAVRDRAGEVDVVRWVLKAPNRLRLELGRDLQAPARVVGAPTACPPAIVPYDIAGYRPMLGFTERVQM